MRQLRDTPLNLTRRGGIQTPRRRFRAALAVLTVVSLALLALERLHYPAIRDLRWRVSEWLTPVLSAAVAPFEPVRWVRGRLAALTATAGEYDELRAENRRLAAAEARAADLERRLAAASALARIVPEQPLPVVSARVIAISSGIFVRTLSINAGRDDGILTGYPVLGGDGLAGRVVDAGPSAARVLLLTDLASRIPVAVGRSGVRAILSGDNSGQPRLEFIALGTVIAAGDEVVTSGVGGVFPRGLRVGRVSTGGPTPRVEPLTALEDLEYVAVLRYSSPLGELDSDVAPGASSGPAASTRSVARARDGSGPERGP